MIKAIYASGINNLPADMIETFQRAQINITRAQSGAIVQTLISEEAYDLLITEDTLPDIKGKALIEKIITASPFMNCVVISDLKKESFHEEYEGLGVLAQLPPEPGAREAQKLIDCMKKVTSLLQKPQPKAKKEATTP